VAGFLGHSHHLSINFVVDHNGTPTIISAYHDPQPHMTKSGNDNAKDVNIKVDWFKDPKYEHVSAVLISHN